MDLHNRSRDDLYIQTENRQRTQVSFQPGIKLTIIFACLAFTSYCLKEITRLVYSTSGHTARDARHRRAPAPEAPDPPPVGQHLPKQSELPSSKPTLRDAGPPSEISGISGPLEPLVVQELQQEHFAAQQRKVPQGAFDSGSNTVAIPHGKQPEGQLAQDPRPSILWTPEISIEQSTPTKPAPVTKPKPPRRPAIRHADRPLFGWLWDLPPPPPTRAPRVMGWRGIGSTARRPSNSGAWPWLDETWSPLAPDTMPWSLSPGDETRCRMGSCY